MRVLEITPDLPTRIDLREHIRSLQTVSLNMILGISHTKKTALINTTTLPPLSIPFYELNKSSWQANLRHLDKRHLSNEDKNLAYIIDKHKPDLIHFHSCEDAIQKYRQLCELSIPFTVSIHSSDIHLKPLENENYLSSLCNMLQMATKVHISYDGLLSDLNALCPSSPPAATIQMIIPVEDITPEPVNPNRHLISVGQLSWENGFHDLVRAMSYVPNVSLDIIGNGIEYRHLAFLIHTHNLQDRVRLIDNISFDECRDLMSQATAYVHTGISQETSVHLLLAMALGKPVFVTNNAGVDELVEDQHNGIYIPIGESIGMAQQFKLLDNSDLMQKVGQAARVSMERVITSTSHAEQFIQFYQSALSKT